MNYCLNCGVELDEFFKECPLCGYTPGNPESVERRDKPEHHPSDIILLHKKEMRGHVWELAGIISFSAIAVCTIVDLMIHKGLSWSLYADTSVLTMWICISLLLLAFGKNYIIIPGFLIAIQAMLFSFDLISPPINWFFKMGLPVAVSFFLSVSIIVVLWKAVNLRGFNILSIAFLVLAGLCITTEIFIDNWLFHKVELHWSAIVAVSVLPIALLLLFVHYRMKRGKRLDSYFHI